MEAKRPRLTQIEDRDIKPSEALAALERSRIALLRILDTKQILPNIDVSLELNQVFGNLRDIVRGVLKALIKHSKQHKSVEETVETLLKYKQHIKSSFHIERDVKAIAA